MGKGDDASFLINFFRGKLLRLTEKEGDLLLLEILSWQPLKRSVSNTHINFPNRKKSSRKAQKEFLVKMHTASQQRISKTVQSFGNREQVISLSLINKRWHHFIPL